MRLRWQHSWGLLGLLALILSGCGMPAANPSPTASVATPPTQTPVASVATPPTRTAMAAAELAAPPSPTAVEAELPSTTPEALQTAPPIEHALHYLLPPRLPDGYSIDQRSPAFADASGFSVQLHSNAPDAQDIIIEGGAHVEEVAREAEQVLNDPQATGALFAAIVVRGQPSVFVSSGYGSRVTWFEQGVPYSLLSPYDQDEAPRFLDSLAILDRTSWQRQIGLDTLPKIGMWIVEVEPGSVAAQAGFHKGQVLISLNDTFIDAAGTANQVIARNITYPVQAIVWDKQRRLALSFTPKDRFIGLTLCLLQRCAALAESDTPAPVPPGGALAAASG